MTNNDFIKEIESNINNQITESIKEAIQNIEASNIKINITITAK